MAGLTNAEIPAGFTTLEQLAIYVNIIAATVYPDNFYLVNNTRSERISDTAIIRTADGRDFFVGRFAVPLNPDYTTPDSPLWTYANENTNIVIPARFKA